MLGRGSRRPSAQGTTVPDGVLTLAGYHCSDNVEQHAECLPPASALRVELARNGLPLDRFFRCAGRPPAADAAMHKVNVTGKNGIYVAGSEARADLLGEEQELR